MPHSCLKCAVFKGKDMTFVQITIPTLGNSCKSSLSCMTNWQHQHLSLLFVHLTFDSLSVCLWTKFSSQSHSFILFFPLTVTAYAGNPTQYHGRGRLH